MPFTIYDASITGAINLITALQGILTKAENHPDADTFPTHRLAPDMYPFAQQIWAVCTLAEAMATALQGRGGARVEFEDDPLATYAEMRARTERTLALLQSVDEAQAVECGDKESVWEFSSGLGKKSVTGVYFCAGAGLPNMYFHAVTAYAILRNAGVEVGKADYLMPFFKANILDHSTPVPA
ncbi:hypothetical protein PWT90_01171 [Aphanocladium album]|nr:hypothetical protein PWT90_01171 [Aphanocladium album]